MKRRLIAIAIVLALLGGIGGVTYYMTHYVDWSRVYYKRFKARDAYVFDKINPRFRKTDPAKLIRIGSREAAARIRGALIDAIWGPGGFPRKALPEAIETAEAPGKLAAIPGVASVKRLKIPIDLGYASYVYLLTPAQANGRLVIYHQGYAGVIGDAKPVIGALLARGYAVAAFNYPGYGENQYPNQYLERFGLYDLSHDRILAVHPRPMRFYIEPVVVAVNYLIREAGYARIDMVGFSAGGWVATVAAAVDPRIRDTVAVAGGYPLYLRVANFRGESPPPQFFPPLLQAANYLEMYVLAGAGEGRRLTQIFNRYDRCCYRNTVARLYEGAVRDAVAATGAGRFQVLIDETHADHKVSAWGIAQILSVLAAPR